MGDNWRIPKKSLEQAGNYYLRPILKTSRPHGLHSSWSDAIKNDDSPSFFFKVTHPTLASVTRRRPGPNMRSHFNALESLKSKGKVSFQANIKDETGSEHQIPPFYGHFHCFQMLTIYSCAGHLLDSYRERDGGTRVFAFGLGSSFESSSIVAWW
jgi:hypothetical protein